MAYSNLDVYLPRKISANMALHITPQTETLYPGNTLGGDLTELQDTEWHNLARCKTAQFEQETDTDQEDAFDWETKTRVRQDNASVIGRRWTFDLERYTVLFDAMYQGVRDPFSAETQTALSAGGKASIYATNDPYLPVAMKLEYYDKNGSLLKTQYMYGNLMCNGSQAFDGKILRPQVVFEVEASVHNVLVNEVALTGQTESA